MKYEWTTVATLAISLGCSEDYVVCKSSRSRITVTFVNETDVNECAEGNKCHPNATCTDTDGSFTCTCRDGDAGDGFTCEGKTTCFDR